MFLLLPVDEERDRPLVSEITGTYVRLAVHALELTVRRSRLSCMFSRLHVGTAQPTNHRILATVQEGFIVHSIYYYFVSNYYNPCALLGKVLWSNPVRPRSPPMLLSVRLILLQAQIAVNVSTIT